MAKFAMDTRKFYISVLEYALPKYPCTLPTTSTRSNAFR